MSMTKLDWVKVVIGALIVAPLFWVTAALLLSL
jgi:hypothetical protein